METSTWLSTSQAPATMLEISKMHESLTSKQLDHSCMPLSALIWTFRLLSKLFPGSRRTLGLRIGTLSSEFFTI